MPKQGAKSSTTDQAEPVRAQQPPRDDAAYRFQVEVQRVVQKQMTALMGQEQLRVGGPVRLHLVINSVGMLEQVDIIQSSGTPQVDALGWQHDPPRAHLRWRLNDRSGRPTGLFLLSMVRTVVPHHADNGPGHSGFRHYAGDNCHADS